MFPLRTITKLKFRLTAKLDMKDTSQIENAIELISNNYTPLTTDCKKDLTNACRLVSLKKTTIIEKEGQFSDKLYFIISGCVRAFYYKEDREITDWFAFENDFICSNNSFYQNIPSKHNFELLEPTTFLEITREVIFDLIDKHHCFERLGRIAVTKTMLHLQQRIVSIQFETAQQKFENLINVRRDIIQRVPLTHIASYLGITLETLSRIRNPKNRI
ncbi:Crp/Fnr family transcriptional regulator [Flavobacterium poyangense]|uniref:Crp/Fnr family transcriptional regulator n=1 Tax=Flavobacterium poyangense TaxID=2204302 RepID=UPI001AB05D3D|nr:Crp/Fnr family transcriptional regulator [Flavobacterium sp. JXAS1]